MASPILAASLLSVGLSPLQAQGFDNRHFDNRHTDIDRVLLISIDGMHAVDYENCVKAGTCPNLAELGKTGINYIRTSTSRPSDSFPGLLALVTGGTPKTVGGFYDVAWDRVLAPPAVTTSNGLAAGPCIPDQNNGTQTEYEEGDEINQLLSTIGCPCCLRQAQ